MNVNVLIDSIVRQTTVLIAQLATAAGARAPLAHTANQIFLDLVSELKAQGLGNKVIADMFGMALRTYHARMQRLSESKTLRGRSLWEAVLEYIREQQTVIRSDVLCRFRNDDPATVKSVLIDLVESGLIFQSGRAESTTYRAASSEEYALAAPGEQEDGVDTLVWVAINRFPRSTEEELSQVVPVEAELLSRALQRLVADGRIEARDLDGDPVYATDSCVVPVGATTGWEAAVFDHYQAMVTAICTKLRRGKRQTSSGEVIGGSTYGFDVWPDHPHRDEVLGLLAEMRTRAVTLREKVEAFNRSRDLPSDTSRVIAYVGQTIVETGEDE